MSNATLKTGFRMKASNSFTALLLVIAMMNLAGVSSAHALPMLTNGDFESGFTSWTLEDQLGSDGTFALQSGTASPVNLEPVPAPPEGANAAMTDAQGPGAHVLYQDFVATADPATLSFELFIGNRADAFFTPATLDFSTSALNQQARVDIVTTTADPFSVAPADILLNLYQTQPGDPLVSGYTSVTTDITALLAAHSGETLRLRFAETDNVFTFQMGVDNVRFGSPTQVPEPGSTLLFAAALAALVAARRIPRPTQRS